MEHRKSNVIVYSTTDYSMFRYRVGNRKTNKNKQKKIIREIMAGNDILDESPLLVQQNNSHLDIHDGQNRFEIAQALGRPVHYIIKKENLSLHNLARNNSNVEKWKSDDYIDCYIQAGNTNYKKLRDFKKKYGFGVGVCINLLTHGIQPRDTGTSEILIQQFEQGLFEIKTYKEAVQFAEIARSFEKFPQWNTRQFVVAITKILQAEICDMDRLMKKYQRDPSRLTQQSSFKDYITNLEQIYNLDNQKRVMIV